MIGEGRDQHLLYCITFFELGAQVQSQDMAGFFSVPVVVEGHDVEGHDVPLQREWDVLGTSPPRWPDSTAALPEFARNHKLEKVTNASLFYVSLLNGSFSLLVGPQGGGGGGCRHGPG